MSNPAGFKVGDRVIARVTLDYPHGYAWGADDPTAVRIPAEIYAIEGDYGIAWGCVKLSADRDIERFPAEYAHIPLDRLETAPSKRVVAVGRVEDGRVMYGSIAADFGADSVALGSYDVDGFLAGYLDGVLFTESVGTCGYGDPDDDTSLLSHGCERSDFSADAVAKMRAECVDFIAANLEGLERYSELRGDPVYCAPDSFGRSEYSAAECAGTDFWLSRNGHGAGFFDRGEDPVFRRLQDAARVYGEQNVYFDGEEITTD